jgi:hypothetical protein
MAQATAAATDKTKKPQRGRVSPTAETNKIVLSECGRTVIDIKKVMERFNCSRNDAVVLSAAAEHGLLPPAKR